MLPNIEPINDWVVIERRKADTVTESGILLVTSLDEHQPYAGVVVAVGEGKTTDAGVLIKTKVKIGDTILYGKYMGQNFRLGGVEYTTLREHDVIGIVR